MMDGGLPLFNRLLQHTLRNLCSSSSSILDSSHSAKWVYAVFWRILPRNYPPPKWEFGESPLDSTKGNKRNWILVWEDGFCDFNECEREGSGYIKGRFGADIFFKMSHEVYNYGEGLVGKVASDNGHKWVFRDRQNESDSNFIASWNVSAEPQPRAWETQFNSGIQTIAIIAVREGIIQLGSFDKVLEDLNLVINIQRKFSYLHSIPGVFAIQRPYMPIQYPYILKPSTQIFESHEIALSVKGKLQSIGEKRLLDERPDISSTKSVNMGWNTPQTGVTLCIPPLLPTMPCSFGALLTQLPSTLASHNVTETSAMTLIDNHVYNSTQIQVLEPTGEISKSQVSDVKVEPLSYIHIAQEEKFGSIRPSLGFGSRVVVESGYGNIIREQGHSVLDLD